MFIIMHAIQLLNVPVLVMVEVKNPQKAFSRANFTYRPYLILCNPSDMVYRPGYPQLDAHLLKLKVLS